MYNVLSITIPFFAIIFLGTLFSFNKFFNTDNAKVLTALLSKINRDRLDERVLSSVDSDLKNLASHLAEYPQFRPIIQKRIK